MLKITQKFLRLPIERVSAAGDTFLKNIFPGREMESEMKKNKILGLVLVLIFSMTVFAGCGSSNKDTAPKYGESAEIKMVVLGSAEQFEKRQDFFVGMDLAIKELKESGVTVTYEKIDDGKSRDNGVALAKDVAKDGKYTLAFTLQNSDTVESVADIFEQAGKPLIIVNEVFDSTMNKNYSYVLAGVISAEAAGKALAKLCESKGIKWVATAHSSSQYENMLARGFNNAATDSKSVYLLDSTAGPNRVSEFATVWDRWNTLGVQAALVSFDDPEWACELIQMIKSQNKNILILGDAQFNDLALMNEYKDSLEGMIVAGSYGVAHEEKLQAFYNKYEKKVMDEIGLDITSVTAQAYDFVHMIAQNVKKSGDAQEFMKHMKSTEGYPGVTDVKFNAKGQLEEDPNYWTVKNGQMYRMV